MVSTLIPLQRAHQSKSPSSQHRLRPVPGLPAARSSQAAADQWVWLGLARLSLSCTEARGAFLRK